MATVDSIHGHDVINFIEENHVSANQVISHFEENYGEEIRFHTCSQTGLTIRDLLNFLISKDKVSEVYGYLSVNFVNVCQH